MVPLLVSRRAHPKGDHKPPMDPNSPLKVFEGLRGLLNKHASQPYDKNGL